MRKIFNMLKRIVRFLGITKPIHLDRYEKKWIKMCKLHYKDKYSMTESWVERLKSLFIEIYGYNPDEDNNYNDYLNCIFMRLLNLYLKIADDRSGCNRQYKKTKYLWWQRDYWLLTLNYSLK